MTIKSSGNPLAFSEIETEFGANGTRSLGSYRITQSVGTLSNLPLDTGIPSSGQIKHVLIYLGGFGMAAPSSRIKKQGMNNT